MRLSHNFRAEVAFSAHSHLISVAWGDQCCSLVALALGVRLVYQLWVVWVCVLVLRGLLTSSSLVGRLRHRHEVLVGPRAGLGDSAQSLVTLVSLCILHAHLHEMKFFLESWNFTLRFVFVKCFLGDQLPSQVLNLKSILFLDRFVFFAHDVPPNYIKFIKDLADAGLVHLRIESLLYFFDFLYSLSWNPLISITIFLCESPGSSLISLNTKSGADVAYWLLTQVLCFFYYFGVGEVLVLSSLLQKLNEFFIIGFHVVELYMNGAFTFPWTVQVLDRLFEVGHLSS